MACFLVPGAEAIVVTAVSKIVEKKNQKRLCKNHIEEDVVEVPQKSRTHVTEKLNWLRNLLWGGTGLLAFEHLWHGEISPVFPFLTAAGNHADTLEMLHEMSTVGVFMAVTVTGVWAVMVAVTGHMTKSVKNTDMDVHQGEI